MNFGDWIGLSVCISAATSVVAGVIAGLRMERTKPSDPSSVSQSDRSV